MLGLFIVDSIDSSVLASCFLGVLSKELVDWGPGGTAVNATLVLLDLSRLASEAMSLAIYM